LPPGVDLTLIAENLKLTPDGLGLQDAEALKDRHTIVY
jgi:hypothetical protein